MITWWASLSVLSKILWGVTLTATLVFIIQSILTFIGADVDGATDFDVDASDLGGDLGGGINLYTFRNFVNFILGFGWTAILLRKDAGQRQHRRQHNGGRLHRQGLSDHPRGAQRRGKGADHHQRIGPGISGPDRWRHHQDRHSHKGSGGNQRKHTFGRRTELLYSITIWKST